MSTKATQTPSTSVVTTVAGPIPGVDTPRPPSKFLDRMSQGINQNAGPPKPSKLEAARSMGQRPLRTRLVDPADAQHSISTTTTPAATEPAPSISTTTTPAEPPPARTPATDKTKPPKRAKGYEGAPGGNVDRLVKSVEKLTKTVVDRTAPPPQQDDPTLSPKAERHFEVLTQMEEMFPKEYKGILARSKSVLSKIPQWEADYKQKNPEATEEDIADARAEFEEKNGVVIDDDDYRRAEYQLTLKPLNEKIEEQQETIRRLQAGEQKRQVRSVVAGHTATAANEVVEAFKDIGDITEVLDAEGNVDPAAAQRIIEDVKTKDPIAAEFAIDAVRASTEFAEGVVLAFSGQETPLLHNVSRFCVRLEDDLAKRDPEQIRNDQGQYFIPRSEYKKLSQEDKKDYYILTPDLVITMANDEIIKMARADIDTEKKRIAKIAPRLGFNPTTATPAAPAAPPNPKPASPATTANIPTAPSGPAPTPAGGSFMDRMKKGAGTTLLQGRSLVR